MQPKPRPTDVIPTDPYGRLWRDLDNFLRARGTSLHRVYCELYGSVSQQKKAQLIAIAKSGGARPTFKTELGLALMKYTGKQYERTFDPEFNATIRSLRPDWFVKVSSLRGNVQLKKKQLLDLAVRRAQRPARNSELGGALHEYSRKDKTTFDAEFVAQLRAIRPDWFRGGEI